MPKLIETSSDGGIVTITLNRPEALNALSRPLLLELADSIIKINEQSDMRVVIFTGAGNKAFCAGADLKERQGMSEEETLVFVKLIQTTFNQVASLKIPTIAALNGHAFGGGLELALACDLRVCSEQATLGLTECGLGIIPGAGGTQRLPHIVGQSRALDLILGAKKISAQEAFRIALVDYLAKPEESAQVLAHDVAKNIAKNAPLAVKAAKKAVLQGTQKALADGLISELDAYLEIIHTKDRLEGLAAFKEKRPPQFRGC